MCDDPRNVKSDKNRTQAQMVNINCILNESSFLVYDGILKLVEFKQILNSEMDDFYTRNWINILKIKCTKNNFRHIYFTYFSQ